MSSNFEIFGTLSFIGSAGLYGGSAGLYGGSARLYRGRFSRVIWRFSKVIWRFSKVICMQRNTGVALASAGISVGLASWGQAN